jgi:ribosomal protein L16 Arg81 hydroxylase
VLVLQVYGEKDWTIFDQPAVYPVDGHAEKKRHESKGRLPLMQPTLRAGEMLYVPRGYVHQAAVKDSVSVHLTFGINPILGLEFIDLLRKRCLELGEFRQDVLGVAGPEALAIQEQSLKSLLHQMIDELSFASFLDECKKKREVVDFYRLGPQSTMQSDAVLVPLVRKRDGLALPTVANQAIAGPVLDRLIVNRAMKLGALCDSFDGEIEADDVKTAVDCLVGGRLVEFTQ